MISNDDITGHAQLIEENFEAQSQAKEEMLQEVKKIQNQQESIDINKVQEVFASSTDFLSNGFVTDQDKVQDLTKFNRNDGLETKIDQTDSKNDDEIMELLKQNQKIVHENDQLKEQLNKKEHQQKKYDKQVKDLKKIINNLKEKYADLEQKGTPLKHKVTQLCV